MARGRTAHAGRHAMRDASRHDRSRSRLALLGFLALAGLLYAGWARSRSFYDADTAQYLGLAESLLGGEGYRFDGRPQTKFPPGVALVYLLPLALFGRDFVWIYRTTVACSVAALAAAWAWWKARGEDSRWLLLSLTAGSVTWYEFSTGASLSETPFALATLLALVIAERGFARGALPVLGFAAAVVAAVLTRTAGVALLAGIGATLLLRRSAPRSERLGLLAGALAGVAALGGWSVWSALAREPFFPGSLGSAATYAATYVDQIVAHSPHQPDLGRATAGDLLLRVYENLLVQLRHAGEILGNLAWLPSRAVSPVAVGAAVLLLLGGRAEAKRPNPLAAWYAAATLSLLLIWPFDEGRRFLMPLLPVLFTFAVAGGRTLHDVLTRQPRRFLAGLLVVCLLSLAWSLLDGRAGGEPAGTVHQLGLVVFGLLAALAAAGLAAWRSGVPPRWLALVPSRRVLAGGFLGLYALAGASLVPGVVAAHQERSGPMRQTPARHASEWLLREAPPGSVVMATDWDAIHFATGLPTVPLPVTGDPATLRAAIAQTQPRFVVINAPREHEYLLPPDHERLARLEGAAPGLLAEAYRSEAVRVFRVDPAASEGSSREPRPGPAARER